MGHRRIRLSAGLTQRLPVSAACHDTRFANEPPDLRPQRVRRIAPVAGDAINTKQDFRDLPLACAGSQSIMNPQDEYGTMGSPIGRKQSRRELAMTEQMEELAQRAELGERRKHALEAVLQHDRPGVGKAALIDVEPDMAIPIGHHGALATLGVDDQRQPGCQIPRINSVRV